LSQASIRAAALTKTYRSGQNELIVLDDLDLEAPAGTRLALVG